MPRASPGSASRAEQIAGRADSSPASRCQSLPDRAVGTAGTGHGEDIAGLGVRGPRRGNPLVAVHHEVDREFLALRVGPPQCVGAGHRPPVSRERLPQCRQVVGGREPQARVSEDDLRVLSVNSFIRNASNPGPPAVIRTVCGLIHSRCSTVRTACGRAGRTRPATLVVDSLIITSLSNGPDGMPTGGARDQRCRPAQLRVALPNCPVCARGMGRPGRQTRGPVGVLLTDDTDVPDPYAKAPIPVMARPTMSVCMVSVPSKVWIASMSTMCRMTW